MSRLKNIYKSSAKFLSNLATNSPKTSFKKIIFSGIQPTSIPHIGNYFGAIRQWTDLQNTLIDLKNNDTQMIISIVDLHAITLPKEPKVLRDYTLKSAAILLACGIDPKRTILYQQSHVPYHGQLSWILSCFANMSQLSHMHQFKSKTQSLSEAPVGLFSYPVLQTADILLYRSTHVPIGEDQSQHLELSRALARKFNSYYENEYFPAPTPILSDFKRLRSLRDASKKMSKSDVTPKSRIELLDTPDDIRLKIRKSITDSTSAITYEPETRLGVANLIDIHCACTDRLPEEIVEDCLLQALDTGEYKTQVADALIQMLTPIQKEYFKIIHDKSYILKVLQDGALKANQIASENYKEITKIIGFSD